MRIRRKRHARRVIPVIFTMVLVLIPGWIGYVASADPQQSGKAGHTGSLVVAQHTPKSNPADFLIQDPQTGALVPYVLIDESTPENRRFRVRLRAATAVGYQDFIFDGASQTVSIMAGDEVILERLRVVTEEFNGQGNWKSLPAQNPHLSYQRHADYVAVTLTHDVRPGATQTTTFRFGFDGQHYIHTVDSKLVAQRGNAPGSAAQAPRRVWFLLEGLRGQVTDQRLTPQTPDPDEPTGPPDPMVFGPLNVEWLGPGLPYGHVSSAARSLRIGPSESGSSGDLAMTMDLSAETTTNTVTVTAPGAFEFIFDAERGGGIGYWYDLENDPDRTLNLVQGNDNLFEHRVRVAGDWYYSSRSGVVELVSQDPVKTVIRQSGTYRRGSAVLDGTTYEITYTIWETGQVGIKLHSASSVERLIDVEDRQLKVNTNTWTGIDEYSTLTGHERTHGDADYIGLLSDGGPYADVVLTQFVDWPRADMVGFWSGTSAETISWRSRADVTWPAGYTETSTYLLLVKPDTFAGYTSPAPYATDYRSPGVSVRIGNNQGFGADLAAYRIGAANNEAAFTLDSSVTRHGPRFVIGNWSASSWTLSLGGTLLSEGTDYAGHFDSSAKTLTLNYFGTLTAGSTVEFTLTAAGVATLTSITPNGTLKVTDEGGTFRIPYIQESTLVNLAARASDIPSGGGIEFVFDSASIYDMSAPYRKAVSAGPGEHSLSAYIVDSAKQRLTNPEAQRTGIQIGIGNLYSTIGDSITAGNGGDQADGAVVECSQSPSASTDCRNFFQHNASNGIYYRGYQIRLNDCLAMATDSVAFLMNEGYGGITSKGILDRMNVYTDRMTQLRLRRVLLVIGTNDANIGVTADTWQANVESIIASLKSAGIPASNIYLGYVPYNQGTGDSALARRARIQEYNQRIATIAANTGINIGPNFYSYFEAHQDQMADNLHPNQAGYDAMAGLWTQSITGSDVCAP